MKTLHTRLASEFLGTAFLVAAVIGSGIMGERLASGNVAIALLANTIATGAALVALILTFGPISGAHFNPVVTLADTWEGGIPWPEAVHYSLAQILGGISGAIAAHLMFGLPVVSLSQHVRTGPNQWFSEFALREACGIGSLLQVVVQDARKPNTILFWGCQAPPNPPDGRHTV